jgi:hypothetical protein
VGNAIFKKKDKIALQSCNIFYSWFNITAEKGNNTFSYIWYSGAGPTATTVNITIPDGFYTVGDLNAYLQSQMIANSHYLITSTGEFVYYLEIVENPTLYAVQINSYFLPTVAQATALGYTTPAGWPGFITANITPRFIIPATPIQTYFGISAGTYPSPTQATNYSKTSDIAPQVTDISSVNVLCSLVNNLLSNPTSNIYNFAPNTTFGSQIRVEPSEVIFSPIQSGSFNNFTVTFLDNNYQPLPIRDPNLTITFAIKSEDDD